MIKKILFVSHKSAQCGVYEFGRNITDVVQNSKLYQFIRVECSSIDDLKIALAEYDPAAIIYNYYESVMPWIATRIGPRGYKNNVAHIPIPQIGMIHEITQQVADTATNYRKTTMLSVTNLNNCLFDFYIAPDPTLLLKNPSVYKTGRLIPTYQNDYPIPQKPVIGSFGFGTPKKGFEKIVELVQQEYNVADIRFNIPFAEFGDRDGASARSIAAKCKDLIKKPGITLTITHDFMNHKALLNFLAQNTLNVFLYEDENGRGLSSTVDLALAVQRPIAVSNAKMFRHVLDIHPSICIQNNTLKTIISNGYEPLQKYHHEWNADNLLWDYERILNSVFQKRKDHLNTNMSVLRSLKSIYKRVFSIPDDTFTWLRNSEKTTEDDIFVDFSAQYQPIQIPIGDSFNRILDNSARSLYKPAINKLTELVPKTMSKKISEANIQQAFVFDTVFRYLSQYQKPKLLCVGSNEDTASMSLIKMGYLVEEIDPIINYSLQEYFTKPSTVKQSYDIIFSTSVIEHDPDDESFVKCISDLLAPGGVAIITCDYKDGWEKSDPKPEVDIRLYTQSDLKYRLLPLMRGCRLVDNPQWDCPNPDFIYLNKYRYTFASFVVVKK